MVSDVTIAWSDVVLGAAMTSLLFTAGKLLIALYLGKSGLGSTYGAAGSLVVLLAWVYYLAQVFSLGAEFTQVYSSMYWLTFRGDAGMARQEFGRVASKVIWRRLKAVSDEHFAACDGRAGLLRRMASRSAKPA